MTDTLNPDTLNSSPPAPTLTPEQLLAADRRAQAAITLDPDRLHLLHLIAAFEDGTAWKVTADQRDWQRASVAIGAQSAETNQVGFIRAQAWAALTRQQILEIGWRTFDQTCVEVLTDAVAVTAVDPTPAAPDE
jgi:hypothetical protein